jgi:hypothetical protein
MEKIINMMKNLYTYLLTKIWAKYYKINLIFDDDIPMTIREELEELKENSLYLLIFKDINLDDYTEEGMKVLLKKCDAITQVMRIKLKNYKNNKLYKELMDGIDVDKLDEYEIEVVNLALIKRSEEIRLKLKRKQQMNNKVKEFEINIEK